VGNVFLCRHPRDSVFTTSLFGNPPILWGVMAELALLLAIVYTSWGNLAFGTAPIGSEVWLFAGLFALVMLTLEELRKAVVRRLASAPD